MKSGQSMIPGAKVITIGNYNATHGHQNFMSYAGSIGVRFLERKSSGLYVVEALLRDACNLADFAGFNCALARAPKGPGEIPIWVVQRTTGLQVIEADA